MGDLLASRARKQVESTIGEEPCKNDDFVPLQWLSPNREELDGGGTSCQGASSLGPRSKRRLFIASGTLSRGGDSSPDGSSSSR
ncbi:unnamed protein product [Spirodela intermedia]|uniref:Uncharacterized protein n=1 Tax=Spirodela intermedia TaxID=51605 RepID=A0ABN7ECM5_SPIIN|nr:unnamed protein product [Spirodela intermedia]CAA6675668.1 unnamed protein product [Spirodela intermedia]